MRYTLFLFLITSCGTSSAQVGVQWQCLNYDWDSRIADTVVTDDLKWNPVIPIVEDWVWDDILTRAEYMGEGRLGYVYRASEGGEGLVQSNYYYNDEKQLASRVDEIAIFNINDTGTTGYRTIESLLFYDDKDDSELTRFEEYWVWGEQPYFLLRSCRKLKE